MAHDESDKAQEGGGGGAAATTQLPAPLGHPRPASVPRLRWALLLLWLAASFGAAFFARALQHITFAGWPLHFWWAAQGSLLTAFAIVAIYAWAMERRRRQHPPPKTGEGAAAARGNLEHS